MSATGDDTRAFAIAGMAMSLGLLSTLQSRRVLSDAQTDALMEGVLTSLENFLEPNDPGIKKARVLVDAMAQIIVANRSKPPK